MRFESEGDCELVLSVGEKVEVWSRATGAHVTMKATEKGIEVKRHD